MSWQIRRNIAGNFFLNTDPSADFQEFVFKNSELSIVLDKDIADFIRANASGIRLSGKPVIGSPKQLYTISSPDVAKLANLVLALSPENSLDYDIKQELNDVVNVDAMEHGKTELHRVVLTDSELARDVADMVECLINRGVYIRKGPKIDSILYSKRCARDQNRRIIEQSTLNNNLLINAPEIKGDYTFLAARALRRAQEDAKANRVAASQQYMRIAYTLLNAGVNAQDVFYKLFLDGGWYFEFVEGDDIDNIPTQLTSFVTDNTLIHAAAMLVYFGAELKHPDQVHEMISLPYNADDNPSRQCIKDLIAREIFKVECIAPITSSLRTIYREELPPSLSFAYDQVVRSYARVKSGELSKVEQSAATTIQKQYRQHNSSRPASFFPG